MLPFPKRPPAPQELELGTGDYVAYERANAPTPQRNRTAQPVFARSAMPRAPYGFPQEMTPYSNVQVAPHVHNDMRMMSHAPPPHSLAPMAMPHAAATSSHRAHDTVVLRARPDVRWGIGLALAGALLGGVFGVTMHNAKRDAARTPAAQVEPAAPTAQAVAAAVAQPVVTSAQPVAPVVAPQAAPQVAPQAAPVVIAPQAQQPAVASTAVLPPPGPPAAPATAYAYAAGRQPSAPAAAHATHAAAPAAPAAHTPAARAPAAHATRAAAPHQAKVAAAHPPKAQPASPPRGGQRLDLATKVPTTPAEKADKSTFVDALRLKSDAQKDLSNTLGGSN